MHTSTKNKHSTNQNQQDEILLSSVCRSLLSCLMKQPEQIEHLTAIGMTADHIPILEFRTLYEAMLTLYAETKYFTPLKLIARIPAYDGLIKSIAGEKHIAGWNYFVRVLNRNRIKTHLHLKMIELLSFVQAHTLDEDILIEDRFANVVNSLKTIDTSKDITEGVSEAKKQLDEMIEQRHCGNQGFATGIKRLNAHLNGGIQKKQLTIIGARPGCGKTTLAMQFAVKAVESNASVLYISVEMDSADMLIAGLANVSKINSRSIRNGVIAQFQKDQYEASLAAFSRFKIRFALETDYQKILTTIYKAVKAYQIDIVFIDYLQNIVNIDKKLQKREQMSVLTANLKRIAVEQNIAVVGCAQLNRAIEGRTDTKPRLSDLKESGSIEQDADAVMFIHRHCDSEKSAVDIHLAKNRRGQTGVIECFADYTLNTITMTGE